MKHSLLTWPDSAQTIQARSETVTAQVTTVMNEAVEKLTAIESEGNYSRHALSAEAEALLGLRENLNALLNKGQVLTASPYQFQVGIDQVSGKYLNPQTAINILTAKLRDHVDKNRPAGKLYCVAIMASEPTLSDFASTLNHLVSALPLPDWVQVARQSTVLSTNSVDKLHQPAKIMQPRFKPQGNINTNPLREQLKWQGAQLATLESLANDKNNVIDKLQTLAVKRSTTLSEVSTSINALKNITGRVWSQSLNGSAESIAAQLNQAAITPHHQHTIASLLLSSQPLTFFEELLC